jgi:hypothetical protein
VDEDNALREFGPMPFIAPPPAPKPKIPPITAGQLADALVMYVKSLVEFPYVGVAEVECDRESKITTITLYGPVAPNSQGRRIQIEAEYYGKAVRNLESKLDTEGTVVSMIGRYIDFKQDVFIEPRADRSIAIFKIIKWENGVAPFCA